MAEWDADSLRAVETTATIVVVEMHVREEVTNGREVRYGQALFSSFVWQISCISTSIIPSMFH